MARHLKSFRASRCSAVIFSFGLDLLLEGFQRLGQGA
jgi:hypothetical protein